MRTSSRSVALVVATLLTAQPVLAQPRPAAAPSSDVRSQLTDTARKAWDAARQLAEAKDYKGALVELQRAYELSNNPRILYNVGALEKLLTHYARAVDAWEKEQAEGGGQLTASELQELKNAVAIVQQFVTTVEVTANETDATLSIDDYPIGKTPFVGPVRIDVGKHVLKLSKDGFFEAVQSVDVAAGAKTPVAFKLDPINKTALVGVVVGGAPNATVFVDGRDMGPAPFKGELSADRHTIEARSPGFVTVGQTVDVLYKQPMSLVLTLSQERHEGRLHITAPEGAAISVDEKAVGAGTWDGVVSTTGGHQLVVTKPGYQTYSTEVFVADDQVRDLDVPLNHEVKTNWVAWSVGTLLVVSGGIVAGVYIFKPSNPSPTEGTLMPYLTTASHGLHF
jgi:PEGA domain